MYVKFNFSQASNSLGMEREFYYPVYIFNMLCFTVFVLFITLKSCLLVFRIFLFTSKLEVGGITSTVIQRTLIVSFRLLIEMVTIRQYIFIVLDTKMPYIPKYTMNQIDIKYYNAFISY